VKTSRLRLKRIAELLQPERQFGTFESSSMAELKILAEFVEEKILAKALPVLLSLVNLKNSPELIADFRILWDSLGCGIEDESDQNLLRFRDELRTIWEIVEQGHLGKPISNSEEESKVIMHQWFSRPINDPSAWWVLPQVGKIIPLSRNLRAVAGRIVIQNHKLLARCANPKCSGRFFLKRRCDQHYCLEEDCQKYGNRKRNKKWRAGKAQLLRVARKGRKKGR
jgi:hypothetical protein